MYSRLYSRLWNWELAIFRNTHSYIKKAGLRCIVKSWIQFLSYICRKMSPFKGYQWFVGNFGFLSKKCVFSLFFVIFHCNNHIFLPNFTGSSFEMRIVTKQFILDPKRNIISVWYQIFVVKGWVFHTTVILSILVYLPCLTT